MRLNLRQAWHLYELIKNFSFLSSLQKSIISMITCVDSFIDIVSISKLALKAYRIQYIYNWWISITRHNFQVSVPIAIKKNLREKWKKMIGVGVEPGCSVCPRHKSQHVSGQWRLNCDHRKWSALCFPLDVFAVVSDERQGGVRKPIREPRPASVTCHPMCLWKHPHFHI